MYDFHNSTDTLKFWTEKWAINKTFFVFHLILMKLGEVVVTHVYYNFTKFHQNQMKNKKVLLIAHFSVHNFKVSVELWKLYIALFSSVQVSSIKRPGNFADTYRYRTHNVRFSRFYWHFEIMNRKMGNYKTYLFFIWFWWDLVKL